MPNEIIAMHFFHKFIQQQIDTVIFPEISSQCVVRIENTIAKRSDFLSFGVSDKVIHMNEIAGSAMKILKYKNEAEGNFKKKKNNNFDLRTRNQSSRPKLNVPHDCIWFCPEDHDNRCEVWDLR